jgi:hypothetical protein
MDWSWAGEVVCPVTADTLSNSATVNIPVTLNLFQGLSFRRR